MKLKSTLTLALLSLAVVWAFAQKTVSGIVTSTSGEPLIGVNVLEVGSSLGTVTDADGSYSLRVTSDNATLEFSYTGFQTQRLSVAGTTTLNVTMQEGVELNEVVVTALGITRDKKALTYAAQTVSGDELTRVKDANVVNALAGKSAGVFINRSGSGVGGSTRVVLRGNKSTRDNQPLYVVDGVPMFNYSPAQPGDVWGQSNNSGNLGRDGGDAIANLNPEDIESISVLKGASASALYGSQAANGVILISTKKGKAGTTSVNFSSNFTVETPTQEPELQFSYGQTAAGSLDSWGSKVSAPDHVDEFFRTGRTWINALTLSSGNDVAQTYFSYANTNAEYMLPGSDFNRHNINLRETATFFDNRLDLSASVNFLNQKANNRPASGLYFNPITGLYFFPRGLNFDNYDNDDSDGDGAPDYEEYNKGRNVNTQNWTADKDDQQNPYWIINRVPNFDQRNRIMTTASLRLKITDNLSIQARGNADKTYDKFDQRAYASTQTTLADANGRYILSNTEGTQYYGDIIAMYDRQMENWGVTMNLGVSRSETRTAIDYFDSKGADLKFANVFSLQNINQPGASITQSLTRRRLNAAFGSLQFGFSNAVYFDFTARNDWSSTLAFTGNESYFYPSFGLTAILSEWFRIENVDFLKARASYAIVGNDVSPYVTNPLNSISSVGGLQVNTVGPIPGTVLKPEKSKSFEAGLDIRTLRNRLNLDLTYYRTSTENQFVQISAPFGSGFTGYLVNAGEIENKGIEAMLEIVPLKSEKLQWSSSLNFTRNKNKVVKLHESLTEGTFVITGAGVNNYAMVIREGSSFGDIQGKTFSRGADGKSIVVDANGKPIGGDFDVVGNPNPDFMLGWNNELRLGNVRVNFLIDGRFGGEVMSITQAMIDELGVSKVTADARNSGGVDIQAVQEDGTPFNGKIDAQTFYQAVGGRAGITEHYVYDATNIRLREFSIGYDFPRSFVQNLGPIRGMRLSFVGRNLVFFKNDAPFDPDLSMSTGTGLQGVEVFSMPSARSYGLNLNVSF